MLSLVLRGRQLPHWTPHQDRAWQTLRKEPTREHHPENNLRPQVVVEVGAMSVGVAVPVVALPVGVVSVGDALPVGVVSVGVVSVVPTFPTCSSPPSSCCGACFRNSSKRLRFSSIRCCTCLRMSGIFLDTRVDRDVGVVERDLERADRPDSRVVERDLDRPLPFCTGRLPGVPGVRGVRASLEERTEIFPLFELLMYVIGLLELWKPSIFYLWQVVFLWDGSYAAQK
jgi:hypothetical protein